MEFEIEEAWKTEFLCNSDIYILFFLVIMLRRFLSYNNVPQLTRKEAALARAKAKFRQRYLLNLNFDHIPVENQIVLMFPGRGSQRVGMGCKV